MRSMRIALLQADPTVGDLAGNAERLLSLAHQAHRAEADIAVTTELAITGYPPRDLLLSPAFVAAAEERAAALPVPLPMLIGTPLRPDEDGQRPMNGVLSVGNGKVRRAYAKQLLPTYDVFDEARYFHAGRQPGLVRGAGGMDLGVTVCEDAWQAAGLTPSAYASDPIAHLAALVRQDVALHATVNLSASPFHHDKREDRLHVARTAAAQLGHPFLLANQVGGNDDLVFDGASIAAWPDGRAVLAPAWSEGVLVVDLNRPEDACWLSSEANDALCVGQGDLVHLAPGEVPRNADHGLEALANAVVTGLADYCRKSGLERIVLGLSGGIDSAVAACVAVEALGPNAVHGLAMPSRHSSQHSRDDARWTAEALGMRFSEIPLTTLHDAADQDLGAVLRSGHAVAAENLQARLRALLVMGHANAEGAMAIATGNKSELAQGYCTLYGDMAGGYAPLGDLWKMEVYALAEHFNARALADGKPAPVNGSTCTKPPSAELAPGQVDEDTLPPYPVLDRILRAHIEDGLDRARIVEAGDDPDVVRDVLARLGRNEHKRWQMPPAPRVSRRAFGQGWRMPLAGRHDWRD